MVRFVVGLLLVLLGPAWAAAGAGHVSPSIDEGIDWLSASLTREIAARYFDSKAKTTIKITVFDFTDRFGNITVGSRYVTDRIRLRIGTSPQFHLLIPPPPSETEPAIIPEVFGTDDALRDRTVSELRSDVYVFGRIDTLDGTSVACVVDLWGIKPPFDDFTRVVNLGRLLEKEDPIKQDILSPLPWRSTFSPSGLLFFSHILVKAPDHTVDVEGGKLGEVIFLSQPMCDDLNLSWQIKKDGMVYDLRKENEGESLRSRTGQVMQTRVRDAESLKELSYVIKEIGLVIKEQDGAAYPLQMYILPSKSDFFFIPCEAGEAGLRFMYLWAKHGLSRNLSSHESGKGWRLYTAENDYRNMMPLGAHIATATLDPIAESEYGTKNPRSQYVSRFKFDVLPGLNIYVINYVFRRDQPEIFVRRLEIAGTENQPVRAVKRITEVYRMYGE